MDKDKTEFTLSVSNLVKTATTLHAMFTQINKDIFEDTGSDEMVIGFEYASAYKDQIYAHYDNQGIELDEATCWVLAHLMYSIQTGVRYD